MPRSIPQTITVALTGNPNSGKTTIFNNLTGANQHVGNYGGVTVETKEGFLKHGPYQIKAVDLPGTYSLTAYSIEEIVARNFIINERPDVIVDIVDGSNLERNLYLAAQLKELDVPLVIALNMADEMKKKGLEVDLTQLSQDIGAPIVPTIGTRNKGTKQLLDKVLEVAKGAGPKFKSPPVYYGEEIENELTKIAQPIIARARELHSAGADPQKHLCLATSPQWVALKLLENDQEVIKLLRDSRTRSEVLEQTEISRKRLTGIFGEDPETIIAEQRYGYIRGICQVVCRHPLEARMNLSDKIDMVLTNRLLGLPIFAMLMYLTFWFVFTLGAYPMNWIETGQHWLGQSVATLGSPDSENLLKSLLLDGIIAGVGGVIAFLPNILLLFLALALLEDTGYMARAAFIMDRLMKWVGLHGKSFIPMLAGFGCSVPAILGTRILDNQRDRLTTILVLPLMSCGARLTIYMLIIPAFFTTARAATVVMYLMYIIGIVLAMIGAKLLRKTVFKGEPSPFVMELPPYRIPTLRAITLHMWQRAWVYLRKAGTIILSFSIIMWFLSSFPRLPAEKLEQMRLEKQAAGAEKISMGTAHPTLLTGEEIRRAGLEYSAAGRVGRSLEPMLEPLGFDWRIGTALIGAFAAKELFVSQMGIVYSLGEGEIETIIDDQHAYAGQKHVTQVDEQMPSTALRAQLRGQYSPLVGFCIMLFCLISTPCMATVAITRRESGGWKWALFQWAGLTLVAYVLTLGVYQVGSLLGIGKM